MSMTSFGSRPRPKRLRWIPSYNSADCGPAALATIARGYGLFVSTTAIRALAGTDLQGTSLRHLRDAARDLGFNASVGKVKSQSLNGLPLPAIAHLNSEEEGHFVVVERCTSRRVEIIDPTYGFVRMRADEFDAVWTGYIILLTPARNFTKRSQTYTPARSLITRALQRPLPFIASGLLSLLIMSCALGTSWLLQGIFDRLWAGGGKFSIEFFGIGFALVSGFRIASTFSRDLLLAFVGRKIEIGLGLNCISRLLSLPIRYFETRQPGDILAHLFDISNIRRAIVDVLLSLVFDLALLLFVASGLLAYKFSLGIVSVGLLPILTFIIIVMVNPILVCHRRLRRLLTGLFNGVIETVANIRLIKTFTAEVHIFNDLSELYHKSQNAMFKSNVLTGIMDALTDTVAQIASLGTVVVGVVLTIHGKLTPGQLIFFYSAVGVYLSSAGRMAPSVAAIQDALVGIERVDELENEAPEIPLPYPSGTKSKLTGGISFHSVSFEYQRHAPVLTDITLTIDAGETIAIIGETGAGKSTLASLISGLVAPTSGVLRMDDYLVGSIDKLSLRDQISVVFQDAGLLNMSVKRNVAFGCPTASFDRIVQCCKSACIHDFISALPNGYDHKVGAQGWTLSGGQRQRIAIARALLKDAPILVLDEATSCLDPQTEDVVLSALLASRAKKTTILITHRMRAAIRANRAIVLRAGKLVEMGTHAELMAHGGWYHKMWSVHLNSYNEPHAHFA